MELILEQAANTQPDTEIMVYQRLLCLLVNDGAKRDLIESTPRPPPPRLFVPLPPFPQLGG